jgi:hypothetical protein
MAMTLDAVDEYARSLPGVSVGSSYRARTWQVGKRFFIWQRPFSKADIKRYGDETPPQGDILGVKVESLDAKDALLAMELPGFFTIPHFNGYAAVLVELRRARVKDVKAAIRDAHQLVANAPKPHKKRR